MTHAEKSPLAAVWNGIEALTRRVMAVETRDEPQRVTNNFAGLLRLIENHQQRFDGMPPQFAGLLQCIEHNQRLHADLVREVHQLKQERGAHLATLDALLERVEHLERG